MAKERDYGTSDFLAKLCYLNLCGEEAARWLAELSEEATIRWARDIFQATALLRTHEPERALALLEAVDQGLRSSPPRFASILHLLQRWHHSAMAYHYYLSEDMEGARQALQRAFDEIRLVLLLDSFLLPLATHCTDFYIQHARIARRENRWSEVQRQIEILRMTYSDRRPFCVLATGRSIYISDLRRFFQALPLDEEQKKAASYALDESYNQAEWIDRLEENIYTLPDLVIPYP